MNCCKKENSNRSYLKKDGTDGFEPLPSKNVISNMSMIYLYMYICISEYILYIYVCVNMHLFAAGILFFHLGCFPDVFLDPAWGWSVSNFLGRKNHLRLREMIFFC